MSSEEVKAKAKETAKNAGELLDAVTRAARARLSREVPNVADALDSSFAKASKGLTEALKTVDEMTRKEQAELLGAYRSFLQKQTEIIDRTMDSKRKKGQTAKDT